VYTTVNNKTGSREVHLTTTQKENTATCPDKLVTKAARRRVALQQEQPLKMVEGIDRNM
jgi:predicted molibdopterin-dependent oxidoreductase YjgC